MTERFVELFQRIGRKVDETLSGTFGTALARKEISRGAFGDMTVYIDRKAEEIVVNEVKKSGLSCSLLSEEIGWLNIGAKYPVIIVDPIDGSLNAKRGVPYFCISLALSESDTTNGLRVGYVRNLANGDEFSAVTSEGAYFNGARLTASVERFSMIAVEGITKNTPVDTYSRVFDRFYRVRQMGSMALDICYLTTGAFDAVFSIVPSRIVDYAAALVILREAGGEMFKWMSDEPFVGNVDLKKGERFVCVAEAGKISELLDVMR